MIEPSELDLAELRHNLRELYRQVGYEGALQVWYEMMVGANTFGEVIVEERRKERGQQWPS